MSDKDIVKEARELLAKATPGPWKPTNPDKKLTVEEIEEVKTRCVTGCRSTEKGVHHDPSCSLWQKAKETKTVIHPEIKSIEDFSARIIELCEQKAIECDAMIGRVPNQSVGFRSGRASAFREVVAEMERGNLNND